MTTEAQDSPESEVPGPAYDDPAVLPVTMSFTATPAVAEPKRGRAPKTPKEPKPPKAAKEPKPAKAPKEPKPPKAARKPKPAKEPKAPKPPKVPKPPAVRSEVSNRRWSMGAAIAGAIGLILSVILAIGALFVALDAAQGSAFFGLLSDVCNALAGPLKDVFSFSGVNADRNAALVGWGLGSVGYLLLGKFLQSVLLSRVKD